MIKPSLSAAYFLPVLGAGLAIASQGFAADGTRADDIRAQLKAFQANPSAFMNAHPAKTDAVTGKPIETSAGFTDAQIKSKDFVNLKNQDRERFPLDQGRSAYLPNDLAENLVDNLKYTTLEQMATAKLETAVVPNSPWSDDYWAIYTGVIAKRFADPNFPSSMDWKTNVDYVRNTPVATDLMSPAEKYDLLVGDDGKTLTNFMLNVGQQYMDATGTVEDWMGICHGWSPAAMMLPRPTKAITVLAADGKTKITFAPSDIKALGSALWANSNPQTKFVGGRCNVKSPATDENGRITDQDCFDTNPGTWHMAVVNEIGVAKRSFVIDATYDYQVWNQPVYGYSYTYFNPMTNEPADKIADAKVALTDYTTDKFKTYRGADAVSVVGVSMVLTYIAETIPSATPTDAPTSDRRVNVTYLYDLELDKDGKIVGGEWYRNEHPDFMWTPSAGQKAVSVADEDLGRGALWDGVTSVPATFKTAAPKAANYGQPLGKVVDELFSLSSGTRQ